MRVHFRSRDEDCGHTTRSAVSSRKPHAAHKVHGSMFYRTGVIAYGSFTFVGIVIFDVFGSFMWPWPWPDDLRIPYRCTGGAKVNFLREGFRKLSSDIHIYIHTYRHDWNFIPRRFECGQKLVFLCSLRRFWYRLILLTGHLSAIRVAWWPFVNSSSRGSECGITRNFFSQCGLKYASHTCHWKYRTLGPPIKKKCMPTIRRADRQVMRPLLCSPRYPCEFCFLGYNIDRDVNCSL